MSWSFHVWKFAPPPRTTRTTGQTVVLSWLVLCAGVTAMAQQFRTEDAFPGLRFDQPLGIVTAPGDTGRVFIVEKPGRIQLVSGLGGTPAKQIFLDLTSRPLLTDSEGGLLGLAFHPQFASNRFFYVFYTVNTTTAAGSGLHDRLSRFTALPSPASNADILATEVPLLSQYDEAANHNGGDLHFGPDGYLYVALGDEGGSNDQFDNSQRIDRDFFSGLLRIDVDRRAGNLPPNAHPSVHAGTFSVPADNPFVGATSFAGASLNAAQVRTEFWAVGLRNPWRFSFDIPTGRLLLGDVGQGMREEINVVSRGGNYGWSYREGTVGGPRSNPPAGLTFIEPIWDADRVVAASITGGVVYRGSRFPGLSGKYIFGDFVRNRIFAMTFPATGPVQVEALLTESTPAGFGVDPQQGDILIASLGSGTIRRLVQASSPAFSAHPADQVVTAGHEVSFSASTSSAVRRWQVSTDGGTTWSDLSDSTTYSGTVTDTLTLSDAGTSLNGNRYRLVAGADASTGASNAAQLTVAPVVFPAPTGVDIDASGNLIVSDSTENTVNRVSSAGAVAIIAGARGQAGGVDGGPSNARFNQPAGVALGGNGVIYVADAANGVIRRIATDGTVTTLAGSFEQRGSADGAATAATFSNPQGIAVAPDGNILVADAGSHTLRRVSTVGQVTTIAGGPGVAGSTDGAANAARFNRPTGIAVDAAGNIYVADTFNNTVRVVAPDGRVSTLAGVSGVSGFQDGTGADALFNQPSGIAVDSSGAIYIADTGNHVIRRVTPGGAVTTIAGLPSVAGKKDAGGTSAWFNHPRALTVDDSGNVFVADAGNAALRRISPQGNATTVAVSAATAPIPPPQPPPPAPNPPSNPGGGGGGGGGAVSAWFLLALLVTAALRRRAAPG